MRISDTEINEDSAFFIAEAGVNHNGDIGIAESLIDAAADAGADAVKFQTFDADRLVTKQAAKADYQREEMGDDSSQYEMLRSYELDREDHEHLQSYASNRDVLFLSTPFDSQSANLLADLDVPAIKLGSGELTNQPLLCHVADFGRPVIISTGMGTMDEVERALSWVYDENPNATVALLHCTSSYPAPVSEVNLRAMQAMAAEFDVPVGLSDHTTAIETPAFSVAAGASIVEKHFTIDRSLPGPDHEASLEPGELSKAVALVRDARRIRGKPEKEPTESERENVETIRKGLHAECEISRGDTYTHENVAVLRPATGLPPFSLSTLVGKQAATDLAEGAPITDEDVSEVIHHG